LYVLNDFFKAFLPFEDWQKKITIQNVTEWLELSEEYNIPIIRDFCLDLIEKWFNIPCLTEEAEKEQNLILVILIGALEKLYFNDLLHKLLSFVSTKKKWKFFSSSPHLYCCISQKILIQLLEIGSDVEEKYDITNIFECPDMDGRICLVKILEKDPTKTSEVKITFLGWPSRWDMWIDCNKLRIPRKSCKTYQIGRGGPITWEEAIKRDQQNAWQI
jgi:hypothetical protein